ncbi:MAG: alpha/beta hydrolase, partial [Cyclobacteriaceae bacterium]
EKLAEEGYIVMVPEYRLSIESRYPAAVEDIIDAIKWIKKNEEKLSIDTTNIALIGCSSGGQLATLIGTKFPVQAVVDIDGILAFHHPDSEEGTMAAQWLGGSYDQIPEVWKEASALTHVSKQTPPTLFIASKYPRFLAGHQEYMQALQVFGIKSEIRFMEDAPHSFWLLSPWFQPTLNHVINFLNNTVLKASY